MMNLRQIEVFRAVMETGTITQAARLLHVSQPGISRLIRHLELRLGVTLFARHRGRLVATEEARILYAEIERAYRGVQRVQDVARHLHHGGHAVLRVLSSSNTALQVVPRILAQLSADYPRTRLAFEALPTREIVKLLVAEEADVAISSAPLDHPALQVQEIGQWQLLCAMPRAHLQADAPLPTLAEALRQRLVAYSHEAPQSALIATLLAQANVTPHIAVEVRSGYAACAMVAAGIGVGFIDELSARAHDQRDALHIVAAEPAWRFPIYVVHNRNRPTTRLAQAFEQTAQTVLDALQAQPLT